MNLSSRMSTPFVLILCLANAPAFAHAHLKSTVPPVDGIISRAPAALDITFSEGVNPKFSGVIITGPNGATVLGGPVELASGSNATLHVALPTGLTPGRYRVEWHTLAIDGHKSGGSYGFTIAP